VHFDHLRSSPGFTTTTTIAAVAAAENDTADFEKLKSLKEQKRRSPTNVSRSDWTRKTLERSDVTSTSLQRQMCSSTCST